MVTKRVMFWLCVCGLMILAGYIYADIPHMINYQGIVAVNGNPFDGTGYFKFAVVNAAGNVTYWSNNGTSVGGSEPTSAVSLSVSKGRFSVQLGDTSLANMTQEIPPAVFDAPERYLRIWFDDGVNGSQLLSPDSRLISTPYSYKADDAQQLDGQDSTDFAVAVHSHSSLDAADGSPTDAVYVDNAGNVGIRTTSPQVKLSLGTDLNPKKLALWDGVSDFYGLGCDLGRITIYTNNTEKMTILNNGNVGIGTAFPERKLHIAGTRQWITDSGTDISLWFGANYPSSTNWAGIGMLDDGSLRLTGGEALGPNPHMTITDSGNVGIGTSSPQQKLHVAGASRFDVNGNIYITTPGGWPGVIAYPATGGHRREIIFDSGGIRLLTSSSSSPSPANNGLIIYENGNVQISARTITGVLEITGGSDLSEQFEVNANKPDLAPTPGMVVSIDPESPGDLVVSSKAHDRKVAGIISGAGGVQPGMLMGQKGSKADGINPVALTGRVYALVDASYGAIEPGDLLTTSDTPGHAMKVTDYTKSQGAIIGKAMSSLDKGKDLVLVLVTLQ